MKTVAYLRVSTARQDAGSQPMCATYVVRRSTTAFSRFNAAPASPFV